MPKPVWVDSRDLRAAAELGDDVLDAARGVQAAFAAEDGTARLTGYFGLDCFKCPGARRC